MITVFKRKQYVLPLFFYYKRIEFLDLSAGRWRALKIQIKKSQKQSSEFDGAKSQTKGWLMSKDDGKRATLRRNTRFAVILSWLIKFKVIQFRNESRNVSDTNCKSYPDSRAISTYNTILDLFKQVRRTSPFKKAAGINKQGRKQFLHIC